MRPGDGAAELSLLLDYVEGRKGESVADPYYGEAGRIRGDLGRRDERDRSARTPNR
jgi:hypothetical protein